MKNAVTKYRTQLGLTVPELADKANVAKETIYKIESGETEHPSTSTLIAVAKVFGISLDELLNSDFQGTTEQQ